MTSSSTAPQAQPVHDAAGSRYELRLGDETVASMHYRDEQGSRRFTHTETPSEHEGKGYASTLAAFALDDVRRQGLRAVPSCSFVRGYIERHSEYADLAD